MTVKFLTVLDSDADQRLDRWFKRQFPVVTQTMIEKFCRRGEIRVDSLRVKPSVRLRNGQVVRIPPFDKTPVRATKNITKILNSDKEMIKNSVIYQDEYLLALNKPAGLAVQGGTGQKNRHVTSILESIESVAGEKPRLVHRLDKETSGVLLIARTRKVAEHLSKSFRERSIRKIYWALVAGTPPLDVGTVRLSLTKKKISNGKEKMVTLSPSEEENTRGAKRATTDFAVIEKVANRATWVGLYPVTGRTHQLRAHMSAIGCPIVGDMKYGIRKQVNLGDGWGAKIGGIISQKLHLHSRSITFEHPITKKEVLVEAELPGHMQKAWKIFNWDLKWAPKDPFKIYEKYK